MSTQVTVSRGHNQYIVRLTRKFPADSGMHIESRAYFSASTLATCQAVSDTIRRDLSRHGDEVICFTDYPVISACPSRSGRMVWA